MLLQHQCTDGWHTVSNGWIQTVRVCSPAEHQHLECGPGNGLGVKSSSPTHTRDPCMPDTPSPEPLQSQCHEQHKLNMNSSCSSLHRTCTYGKSSRQMVPLCEQNCLLILPIQSNLRATFLGWSLLTPKIGWKKEKSGDAGFRTQDLSTANRALYHWATSPWQYIRLLLQVISEPLTPDMEIMASSSQQTLSSVLWL